MLQVVEFETKYPNKKADVFTDTEKLLGMKCNAIVKHLRPKGDRYYQSFWINNVKDLLNICKELNKVYRFTVDGIEFKGIRVNDVTVLAVCIETQERVEFTDGIYFYHG